MPHRFAQDCDIHLSIESVTEILPYPIVVGIDERGEISSLSPKLVQCGTVERVRVVVRIHAAARSLPCHRIVKVKLDGERAELIELIEMLHDERERFETVVDAGLEGNFECVGHGSIIH